MLHQQTVRFFWCRVVCSYNGDFPHIWRLVLSVKIQSTILEPGVVGNMIFKV